MSEKKKCSSCHRRLAKGKFPKSKNQCYPCKREYSRRYRAAKRQRHECYDCAAPTAGTHIRCTTCRTRVKVTEAKRQRRCRRQGVCIKCSKPVAKTNVLYCPVHAERQAAERSNRRTVSVAERRAMIRRQRGKCPVCTKPLGNDQVIDHSHENPEIIRGVLHSFCNQRIVWAAEYHSEDLMRAQQYLGNSI